MGVLALGSLTLASTSFAQSVPLSFTQKAQQAVLTRQAVFDLVRFTWEPAAASLHPGAPPLNPAEGTKLAQRLQMLATYIPEVFAAADTHAVPGLKTRARDAIWTNESDFDQKAADLGTASAALGVAARAGNAEEIRTRKSELERLVPAATTSIEATDRGLGGRTTMTPKRTLLSRVTDTHWVFSYNVGLMLMCRNIRTLFNFDPPATDEEIRAAALQFVRKLSGFNSPSKINQVAFDRAVEDITMAASNLIASLVTYADPRNREVEAARARARAATRFAPTK